MQTIKFLQSFSNPFLDTIFNLLTMFGEPMFIVLCVSIVYWTVNKQSGIFLIYSIFTTFTFNGLIKDTVKAPRPIGENGITSQRVHTATGYSFPSGHSQSSAAMFTALALLIKQNWFIMLSVFATFLVAISRLYLGVHYPADVIGGLFFGLVTTLCCYFLYNKVKNKKLLFIATFIVLLLYALTIECSDDTVKSLGFFIGFFAGYIFEEKFVNFEMPNNAKGKFVRVTVGLIFLLAIYLLFDVFPKMILLNFIKYVMISFMGIGIYPFIFDKFKF